MKSSPEFDKENHDRLVMEITSMLATRTKDAANLCTVLETITLSVMFMMRQMYGGPDDEVKKVTQSIASGATVRYDRVIEKVDADN